MKKILPFFLLVLLLASCQKDPDMSKLSDDFVVFTDHNKDANFESFTTFYIPDSVMVIGNSEKPEFWSATEANDIVSTLVSGMEGRGYTRTMDKEAADLGLQVSFVKNVNYFTNYHDNPYWWWGYPGYNWWYGYWGNWTGAWNGWYYPYPVTYSYNTGTLIMEMVNLTDHPEDTSQKVKLPVIWHSYATGLLFENSKYNMQLTLDAVNQAFDQSPYIKKS